MADINTTQMRDALAWATNDQRPEEETSGNVWEWFWQAIQGDFNEDRSTGQIVVDAAISLIPLVDQVCDVRDLIANCKKLREDVSDTWAWVALALTLIGLFPFLGSFVKGVLKVFFAFVRRTGSAAIGKAVDGAMTWVVTLLRREEFQKYLRTHRVDEVFSWLADEIKSVQGKLTTARMLDAFDKSIGVLNAMARKVENIPIIGEKAKTSVNNVLWVRARAQQKLDEVGSIIDSILFTVILRLKNEKLRVRHGIVDVNNIHYRGTLPESTAVTLMRTTRPRPGWLSDGKNLTWPPAKVNQEMAKVKLKVKDGWPPLSEQNILSFHTLIADEIKGPARLIRIISPNSRGMSDCWISEKVFNDIKNSPDPREAWRKNLGVWPDWNANGQFVVYDIKRGDSLKVWRGPASSQVKESLPDAHLEGGWEQIIFNIARTDPRNDVVRYYQLKGGKKNKLQGAISQEDYGKLSDVEKGKYIGVRESIEHPNISGPFETGWGYTDFDGAGLPDKIGLPSLPGQASTYR